MKKQKEILHCIIIASIFLTMLSIIAACSEKREIANVQGPYYPYDLFVPGVIITISFGR